MSVTPKNLIERIHASPTRTVIAVSGGGSRAVADLLDVPGASRTVLEAVVPYSQEALIAWLGGRPDQFCSPQAARAMAMAAFHRACDYAGGEGDLAGVACTAGLVTDRPKRGAHRAHVALQTASLTATWSVELEKGRRDRTAEEDVASRLVLNAVAAACGLSERLDVPLIGRERVETLETTSRPGWQALLLGKTESVCEGRCEQPVHAVLSGAFNPLHRGHRQMAAVGSELLGTRVAFEISIVNFDKPPLDYSEIERRVEQFSPNESVWLSRAASFEEKSRLFPGATFLVGTDTLRRIASPAYYGGDEAACRAALERIASRGCRFLVFGRDMGTGFMRLTDLDLPDVLRDLSRPVPAEKFREDVSSTGLRRAGKW